ncbi:hypothetical protein [Rubrivivax gelatinosus]|uniref:Uncharacterized protein n=1 Tax=Rubrivivax gelatinosus (strain NBRC 100245 / IL144) TaxID=983917 RepID=I0HT32_RUBGI|nr:hypothetical protein [Rubrivivax gelatinosus]BAL96169.1 hypothetical protein RGE_28300 [Rubrivivax gelatinosus IL144]
MAEPQFCLLTIDHWSTCMTKSEWSGWMQAIGSVFAIVAGVLGIWYQLREQQRNFHRQQAAQSLGQVIELRDLLLVCSQLLQEANDSARTPSGYQLYLTEAYRSNRWTQAVELMREAKTYPIPGADLKVAFRVAIEQVECAFGLRNRTLLSLTTIGPEDWDARTSDDAVRYAAALKVLTDSIKDLEAGVDRLQARC